MITRQDWLLRQAGPLLVLLSPLITFFPLATTNSHKGSELSALLSSTGYTFHWSTHLLQLTSVFSCKGILESSHPAKGMVPPREFGRSSTSTLDLIRSPRSPFCRENRIREVWDVDWFVRDRGLVARVHHWNEGVAIEACNAVYSLRWWTDM